MESKANDSRNQSGCGAVEMVNGGANYALCLGAGIAVEIILKGLRRIIITITIVIMIIMNIIMIIMVLDR